MNKILKVILVTFLIILAGEVFYYFYSFYGGKTDNKATNSITTIPTLIPTNGFSIKGCLINTGDLINQDVLSLSYLSDEFKRGNILNITNIKDLNSPFPNTYPNYHPVYFIKLETEDEKKNKFAFYFDQTELSNLIVKKQNGNKIDVLSFKDLKEGQTVIIKETWDLIKKKITNYEITIL